MPVAAGAADWARRRCHAPLAGNPRAAGGRRSRRCGDHRASGATGCRGRRGRRRSSTRGGATWNDCGPSIWTCETIEPVRQRNRAARHAARGDRGHARVAVANAWNDSVGKSDGMAANWRRRGRPRPWRLRSCRTLPDSWTWPNGNWTRTSGCCPAGAMKWRCNAHGSRASASGRHCWTNSSGATKG